MTILAECTSATGQYSYGNLFSHDINGHSYDSPLETGYKAGYLREIEELYSTNSFYQDLRISKRFSDLFRLSGNFHIEYAKRSEVDMPDEKKWFDNTLLNGEFYLNEFNSVRLFVSASLSDSVFTSYGAGWKSQLSLDEVMIKNNLTLAYDYFYYWNHVGQYLANDDINIEYNGFSLSTSYTFAVVDYNYVDGYEEKARNPNSQFSLDLRYRIMRNPVISTGFGFSTRDYRYYSPLYYSPQDRKLSGLSATFYDDFGNYYIYLGSGIRIDNNDTFIWDIDSETGYFTDNFSVSAGISRYNDPYYTSYNTFLNLTKNF